MTLLSVTVAAGGEPATGEVFLDPEGGTEAMELITELRRRADQELSLRNPIEVQDAMAAGADVACCPLNRPDITLASVSALFLAAGTGAAQDERNALAWLAGADQHAHTLAESQRAICLRANVGGRPPRYRG